MPLPSFCSIDAHDHIARCNDLLVVGVVLGIARPVPSGDGTTRQHFLNPKRRAAVAHLDAEAEGCMLTLFQCEAVEDAATTDQKRSGWRWTEPDAM